jgi:hypothetical protein
VRPPRADIAAPPFPPGLEWVGGPEPRLERMVAQGPLLVHFFDLAQLNCARALPYVEAWGERYREDGLGVLGVHSPRFPFTGDGDLIAASLPRLGIEWPVAVDSRHATWRAYGCQGWPSLFLWSRGGALRWYHLGEGEYEATELAIREALEEAGSRTPGREAEEVAGMSEWPAPLEPLRAGDEAGAEVIAPSPEFFPGGAPESPLGGGEPIEFAYEGGGAFLAADGEGEVAITLDGEELPPVLIRHPGLHALVVHERHERHTLRLDPDPGLRLHSLQFAPAPPS